MNARLHRGELAPHFSTTDMFGRRVNLQDYAGRWLLLSFYRYASCPFCNLRVHDLSTCSAGWRMNGLDMLAVFQSPAEKMYKYVGSQHPPFSLLPDPEQKLYQLYGIEHSWKGLLTAAVGRFPEIGRAIIGEGFLPGSVEGGIHRMPADFLIDPHGRIAMAYYGKDIGDHLPLVQISALMSERPIHG